MSPAGGPFHLSLSASATRHEEAGRRAKALVVMAFHYCTVGGKTAERASACAQCTLAPSCCLSGAAAACAIHGREATRHLLVLCHQQWQWQRIYGVCAVRNLRAVVPTTHLNQTRDPAKTAAARDVGTLAPQSVPSRHALVLRTQHVRSTATR